MFDTTPRIVDKASFIHDCAALDAHQPKGVQGATFLPRIPDGVSVALIGSFADPIFAAFARLNYSAIVLVKMGGRPWRLAYATFGAIRLRTALSRSLCITIL